MYDLLSVSEDVEAATRGWSLEYIFDLRQKKLLVQILPIHFGPPYIHSVAATSAVINQARGGDPLATKALRLMSRGFQRSERKK